MKDIATVRKSSVYAIAAIFLAVGILTLVKDLGGKGLKTGIYYKSFGPVVFFVFYGSIVWGVIAQSLLVTSKTALWRADGSFLHVRNRKYPLSDLENVTIYRNFIGVKKIAVAFEGTRPVKEVAYLFNEDVRDIREAILDSARSVGG